jgi:hypothetical protein
MEEVGLGLTVMAWNGGNQFWHDPQFVPPRSATTPFFEKGTEIREKEEKNEGFPRPGVDFVAPGKND